MLPAGWKWVEFSHGVPSRHTAMLRDSYGRNRANVWGNGTWHVWDEHGCGGENDVAPCTIEAMLQVEAAHQRAGWSNEPPPPPPPEPLSAEDIDKVEEALRDTYGDADEAGAFSQHVVDVLRAYERLRNE